MIAAIAAAIVLTIGDSITAGSGGVTAWPTYAAEWDERGQDVEWVNIARGGSSSRDWANNRQITEPYHDTAQEIHILIGGADPWKGVPPEEYWTNLIEIASRFSGLVIIHEPYDPQGVDLEEYRAMVRRESYWALGADLSNITPEMLRDGVHPTDPGSRWIAMKVVPEPSTYLLMAAALLGLACLRRLR